MLRKSTLILCLILTTVRSLSAQTNIIDSLQNIVALQRHDSAELTALLSLANEFLRKDFEKTNAYAHQAITLASIQQNKFRLANGYQYLVTVNQNTGRLDSAEYYLKLLASLSKSGNEKLKISYNQTAGLFYKNQGQFQKALPYMIENLDLLKTENEGRAGQLLNIGNTYKNLGDYQKAVDYHLQALSLFEKLDSKRGQSFCLQSLGNDFFEIKQFKNAQTYYLRSLQLKKELQDRRGIITALIGLGDVNKEFKNYAGSEKYYNNALQEAQEMKLLSDEARCYYQLSLLYQQMDEKEKSLATIVQGLKLARQSGDSTLSAKMNGNLLALKSEKEKESETEFTLLKNLTTLINAGDRSGEAFAYAQLSEHFASKNQYEKAFLYLQKYESLKDSVEGSDVLLQIKNLEEQYQNDKSEKAIELLKKDQQLQALALTRERTNVMLITVALISVVFISGLLINRYRVVNRTKRQLELEKVRNHIARDLHDDIGSTLSSINIISQLGLKGDAQIHLQKIAIHSSQMMDNMSDIVWSINPKNDTFEQVVIRMKEFAFEILEPNEITPSFQLDPALSQQLLTVEKRKNLFLIFKEAINNAAKYSQASKVSISLAVSQGKIHLAILDNGIGFDQNKIFHGNGLMNMKERAIAIGGQLSQKSQPGGGTEIHLEIPVT